MTEVDAWLTEFAAAAKGRVLSEEERELILALAGVAAHASERTAAPLTCWVASAAGLSPSAALDVARSLAHATSEPDSSEEH